MNKVILGGYLGEDPELKHTNGGQAILKLRLATRGRFKDKQGQWQDTTEWHNVVMWGKRGEALAQYISKGTYIVVEGELKTRAYETQQGEKRRSTEVIAKDIEMTGRGAQQGGDYQEDQRPQRQRAQSSRGFVPQEEDHDPQTGFGG